ncbi:MAG: hypothetical protein ACRD4Y_17265 [Candidatus Acidiferrales bacterium]
MSAVTYRQSLNIQYSLMKLGWTYKISGAVTAAIAMAVAPIIFFQVRELLAALLILSVLFAAAGLIFFILFFVEELSFIVVARLEAAVNHLRSWHSGVVVHSGKGHMLRSPR